MIDDMDLRWNRKHDNMLAVGQRATYTITQRGVGTQVLTAVGHDGLTLLDLPPFGAYYFTELAAKQAAEQVDSRRYVEPEMSGT